MHSRTKGNKSSLQLLLLVGRLLQRFDTMANELKGMRREYHAAHVLNTSEHKVLTENQSDATVRLGKIETELAHCAKKLDENCK